MSLREITSSENSAIERHARLVRILFTEDAQIYAVWMVQKGAKHRELTIQVSEAIRANIMGRVAVQSVIDAIRDDTSPKTNV